jgi:hypothetical protein
MGATWSDEASISLRRKRTWLEMQRRPINGHVILHESFALTKTACAGKRTLLTLDMIANVAESLMTVVSMLALARALAMPCPPK